MRGEERLAALAWARDWRVRNRAWFDALYPETVNPNCCAQCGQRLPDRAE